MESSAIDCGKEVISIKTALNVTTKIDVLSEAPEVIRSGVWLYPFRDSRFGGIL
jgi:hypothetical protein